MRHDRRTLRRRGRYAIVQSATAEVYSLLAQHPFVALMNVSGRMLSHTRTRTKRAKAQSVVRLIIKFYLLRVS